ncbi:MAG: hypothetical protein AAFY36_00025 [Bacteroidota bacterium]
MNHLLLLFVILLGANYTATAQQLNADSPYMTKDELVSHYDLDESQAAEIDRIIDQRESNLSSLEAFTIQDTELYWNKRRAIYFGELTSIRLILDKPDQFDIHDAELRDQRKAETELVRELVAAGHEPKAARLLMLERY